MKVPPLAVVSGKGRHRYFRQSNITTIIAYERWGRASRRCCLHDRSRIVDYQINFATQGEIIILKEFSIGKFRF